MKAAVLTEWEKIVIKNVKKPEISVGDCLVKVKYAGICGSDLHIFGGHHPTAKAPVILGHEFVGTVEEIGLGNHNIKKGDRVVAEPLISCGTCEACRVGNHHVCRSLKLLGIHTNGGFAEYVKVPVKKVIKINDAIPDKIAALTEPFAVGFHANQRAGVRNGDKVLIIGGGPIGLIIGMVALISGAAGVLFSELKSERIEQINSFGFEVMNPAADDPMEVVNRFSGSEGFDVVFEVSGSQPGILFATQACKIRGTVVPVGFPAKVPEFNLMNVIFKELSIIGSRVYTFEDFKKATVMLKRIVHNKLFDLEKLISETYRLEELEDALLYMRQGKNLGKILIKNIFEEERLL